MIEAGVNLLGGWVSFDNRSIFLTLTSSVLCTSGSFCSFSFTNGPYKICQPGLIVLVPFVRKISLFTSISKVIVVIPKEG